MKKLFIAVMVLTVLTSAVYAKSADELKKDLHLTEAVKANNVKKVKKLLKKGADPNNYADYCGPKDSAYKGPRPCAIIGENAEIIKALIDGGADFKECYYAGIAIRQGNKEILELLLDAGTPPDCYYINGLENKEVAQVLANHAGANKIKEQDKYFQFFNAVQNNDLTKIKASIKAGMSANAKYPFRNCLGYHKPCQVPDWEEGAVPLMVAQKDETVKLLVQLGADPNTKGGYFKETALMSAQSVEMVDFLIKAGADVNATDKDGNTVLKKQVAKENNKIIETLIKSGAKVNADALTYARTANAVNLLVRAGADVNGCTTGHFDSNTPLIEHIKRKSPNTEVIMALLKNGADVNKTCTGYNPLSFALLYNHPGLAVLLQEEYGAELENNPKIIAKYNELLGKNIGTQQKGNSTLNTIVNGLGAMSAGYITNRAEQKYMPKTTKTVTTTVVEEGVDAVSNATATTCAEQCRQSAAANAHIHYRGATGTPPYCTCDVCDDRLQKC